MVVVNKSNASESWAKTENKQPLKSLIVYSFVLILMGYMWLLKGKQEVAGYFEKQQYSDHIKKKKKESLTGILSFSERVRSYNEEDF